MALKIMRRLKFSASDTERAANLIRNHMFYYSVDEVTETAVRRIIKKVGLENILFHNHLGTTYRYSYPLIQYKVIRKNPAIICINQGSEEILKFFEKTDWTLDIHDKVVKTEIKHISFDYFVCNLALHR